MEKTSNRQRRMEEGVFRERPGPRQDSSAVYGWMDKAPYTRRQQTCAHLSVCGSGLSFATQETAEMNGRKKRIVPFRNICQNSGSAARIVIIYILLLLYNQSITYLLTPWSRVLLENLTGSAASQEIPRIFGTRRFLTVPTSARHLSLSWANSIQSPQLPPTSWRSILILSSHLRLGHNQSITRLYVQLMYSNLKSYTRPLY